MEEGTENIRRSFIDEPFLNQVILMSLRGLGVVDEGRRKYLSDYRNVLNDLPGAIAEDWDLTAAFIVHIVCSGIYENNANFAKFQEASLEHIERLMHETDGDRPKVLLLLDSDIDWPHMDKDYLTQFREENLEDVESVLSKAIHYVSQGVVAAFIVGGYKVQPRLGTYIYSRIAMAMLGGHKNPQAMRLYEDVLGVIWVVRRTDISVWDRSLIRDPLRNLYEQAERYEDALKLSIPPEPRTIWTRSSDEKKEEDIARLFISWMTQLSESRESLR